MSRTGWPAILVLAMPLAGCAEFWRWEQPPRPVEAAPSDDARPAEPERTAAPGEYLVRSGDTVYSIAFRHQLDFRELAAWNGISDDFLIRPGDVLRLSAPAGPVTLPLPRAEPAVAATAAPGPVGAPRAVVPASPAVVAPGPTGVPGAVPVVRSPAPESNLPLEWEWPTRGPLARRFNPSSGAKGVDITGTLGQAVAAAAPGKVVYSGSALKGYGELIIIKHDDVHLSAYGYNRKRLVREGDVVRAGQAIAELGLGPEQKPMLHFEIRERGKPIDPMRYLRGS